MQLCDMATSELWSIFPVILSKDNLEYKIWFDDEKRYLKTIFQGMRIKIYHIGSTAVSDLTAMPVVDLLIHADKNAFDHIKKLLNEHGYQDRGNNVFSKQYSNTNHENRAFCIYLKEFGENDDLYFRDWLMFSSKSRTKYEALKDRFKKELKYNKDSQVKTKDEFIQNCVVLAKIEFENRHKTQHLANIHDNTELISKPDEMQKKSKKRIVFMGTPEYAVKILAAIIGEGYEVPLVLTQPDKPVGRKGILTPPDVKKYLLESGYKTDILQPTSLKNSEVQTQIQKIKPDFIVVAAYGQILPKEILEIAPCINLHASILPKFRGASPIQSAILKGEKLSGVTAMIMDEGLDDGDMLAFSYVDIEHINSGELFDLLSKVASNLILNVLERFKELSAIPQMHALSSKCKKIKKQDGRVDFSDNTDEIIRKYRAFTPWPGIFLENGVKLLEIKFHKSGQFELGVILNLTKDGFVVGFKDGAIEFLKLQEPGKKPISGIEFINGKRLKIGDRISR